MSLYSYLYDAVSKLQSSEQLVVEQYVSSMPAEAKEQAREYARQVIKMLQIMDSDNLSENSFSTIKSISEKLIQTLDAKFFATPIADLRTVEKYAASIEEMMRATQSRNDRPVIIITMVFQQEQYVRKSLNKMFFEVFSYEQKLF